MDIPEIRSKFDPEIRGEYEEHHLKNYFCIAVVPTLITVTQYYWSKMLNSIGARHNLPAHVIYLIAFYANLTYKVYGKQRLEAQDIKFKITDKTKYIMPDGTDYVENPHPSSVEKVLDKVRRGMYSFAVYDPTNLNYTTLSTSAFYHIFPNGNRTLIFKLFKTVQSMLKAKEQIMHAYEQMFSSKITWTHMPPAIK